MIDTREAVKKALKISRLYYEAWQDSTGWYFAKSASDDPREICDGLGVVHVFPDGRVEELLPTIPTDGDIPEDGQDIDITQYL